MAAARLRYDLDGCSLPPKVDGVERGAVLLSVPRLVPSATADAAAERRRGVDDATLPPVTVVRTRWWGEDKPGSLFRPTLIVHEQTARDPQSSVVASVEHERVREPTEDQTRDVERSVVMRYPVMVPAQQLLDYFRDMKSLAVDVIDRATRKKYGKCSLPLDIERLDQAESAEECLERLAKRSSSTLLEIHSTRDHSLVLGYLAVEMSFVWSEQLGSNVVGDRSAVLAGPTVAFNRELMLTRAFGLKTHGPDELENAPSWSSVSSLSDASHDPSIGDLQNANHRHHQVHRSRLLQLLEKGRALQRSMSFAADDPSYIFTDTGRRPDVFQYSEAQSLAIPHVNAGTDVSPMIKSHTVPGSISPNVMLEHDPDILSDQIVERIIDHDCMEEFRFVDAIQICYSKLELESTVMDTLRQARDRSVTTRYSPIEISVSHSFQRNTATSEQQIQQPFTTAFSVTSSLRRREWWPEASSTLRLPTVRGTSETHKVSSIGSLAFKVICEPRPPQSSRKRARRPLQDRAHLELVGTLSPDEIIACHQERTIRIPLSNSRQDVVAVNCAPIRKDGKQLSKRRRSPVQMGALTITIKLVRFPTSPASVEDVDDRAFDLSSNVSSIESSDESADIPMVISSREPAVAVDVDEHRSLFMMIAFEMARLHWTERLLSRIVKVSEQPQLWSVRLQSASPNWFRVDGIRSEHTLVSREHFKIRPRERMVAVDLNFDATIQFDATTLSMQRLVSGVLIFEVWLHNDDCKADVFAGVARLPLSGLISVIESTILQVSPSLLPLLGYRGALPLDDPTSGSICGDLSVNVTIGTAEQIMNYQLVSKGVAAIQRKFRASMQRSSPLNDEEQCTSITSAEEQPEMNQSPSCVTSGASLPSFSGEHEDGSLDMSMAKFQEVTAFTLLISLWEAWNVCDPGGYHKDGYVGCEVHGQVLLGEAQEMIGVGPSTSFLLWWDAKQPRLNSRFMHTFQVARGALECIDLSEVQVVVKVVPQQHGGAKPNNDMCFGTAQVSVASLLSRSVQAEINDQPGIDGERRLQLPLLWNGVPASASGEPPFLPLGLELIMSERSEAINKGMISTDAKDGSESTTILSASISTTEKLLPPSISLCVDVQRLSNLEGLIRHVRGGIDPSKTMQCWIQFKVPLGLHLHSAEASSENITQESSGFMWKTIDVSNINVDWKDIVTLLPSATRTETRLIVHHELILTLQTDPLFLQIGLESDSGEMQLLGTATIPVGDVLTRHTGVQGSFPIVATSEPNARTGSRVGVHIFFDQDDENGVLSAKNEPLTTPASTDTTTRLVSTPSNFEEVTNLKRPVSATASSAHTPTTANSDSPRADLSLQVDSLSDGLQTASRLENPNEADASHRGLAAVTVSPKNERNLSSSEWSQQASESESQLSGVSGTGSLASTVESIHLATKKIDLRLRRLTGQVSEIAPPESRGLCDVGMRASISLVSHGDAEGDCGGTDDVEDVSLENEASDDGRLSSPSRSDDHQASHSDIIADTVASCIAPGSVGDSHIPAAADCSEVNIADGISSPDESEEGFLYRPLTLASLGITELELSTSSDSCERCSNTSATLQPLTPSFSPKPLGSGCLDSVEADPLSSQSIQSEGIERTEVMEAATSEFKPSQLEDQWDELDASVPKENEIFSEDPVTEFSGEEVEEGCAIEPFSQVRTCGDDSDGGPAPMEPLSDDNTSEECKGESDCEQFESKQGVRKSDDTFGSETDDTSTHTGETKLADGSDQSNEREEQQAHDVVRDEEPSACSKDDEHGSKRDCIDLSVGHGPAAQDRHPAISDVNCIEDSESEAADEDSRQGSRDSELSARDESEMGANSTVHIENADECTHITEPDEGTEANVVTALVPALAVAETQTVGKPTEDAEAQFEEERCCIDAATQTEDLTSLPQLSSTDDNSEHIDEEIQTDTVWSGFAPHSTSGAVSKSCQCQITTTESFTQHSRPVSPAQVAIPVEKFDLAWQLLHELRDRIDSEFSTTSRSLNTAEASRTDESETNDGAKHQTSLLVTRIDDAPNEVETPVSEHVASEGKESWDWPDAIALKTEVGRRLPRLQFKSEDLMTTPFKEVSSLATPAVDNPVSLMELRGDRAKLKPRAMRTRMPPPKSVKSDETERIARIMQGTLSYWLGDSDDQRGDNRSCDEDDSFSSDSDDSLIF